MQLRSSTLSRRQAHLTTITSHTPHYLQTEPNTYNQAKPFAEWRTAMSEELNALLQKNTWTLVPRPLDKNVIGNKWIFRIKRRSDGSIDCYKACLVAKGYNQQFGFDYSETFSPVVKMTTIRTVITLSISLG